MGRPLSLAERRVLHALTTRWPVPPTVRDLADLIARQLHAGYQPVAPANRENVASDLRSLRRRGFAEVRCTIGADVWAITDEGRQALKETTDG